VVLEDFTRILWAADLSFLVQVAGNLALIFYRPPRFAAFVQILTTAAGFVSLIVFYVVFPLDFSQVGLPWINSGLKVVLVVGMAGTVIGMIALTVQVATRWKRFAYEQKK
jgi:hypothetical protein